ncbi:SDR family NAD(P)-dependent oxidoreductase [Roseateles sp.]|uniref:SDR family NAD(P)-dependent oxidoreductase n=1 Tax=Roseateles sp. TaxID=1971397 RepID=UPI0039E9650C
MSPPTSNTPARRVLVTGAASGIGQAVAQAFLESGDEVLGWDLQGVASQDYPIRAVDIRDPDAVRAAAEQLERLDLLVNCAGIARRAHAATMAAEDWRAVIDTNLSGTFYCCQAAFPALKAAGSSLIINVASFVAHRSGPGRASYVASKAGVVGLTQVLALDFAEHGVRAISVSPGYTRTAMVEKALEAGRLNEQRLIARIPAGRLAAPLEIGRAIRALAEPALAYANGCDFVIDGGIMANGVE